jgi:hypothetical protein
MEEGRRMFQIFAARMFEQRVLAAYREKVAQERQQRLLEELEEEDRLREEREAKKQKEREKKKDKKRYFYIEYANYNNLIQDFFYQTNETATRSRTSCSRSQEKGRRRSC